jgi:hypothetical protein
MKMYKVILIYGIRRCTFLMYNLTVIVSNAAKQKKFRKFKKK